MLNQMILFILVAWISVYAGQLDLDEGSRLRQPLNMVFLAMYILILYTTTLVVIALVLYRGLFGG